MKPQFFALLTIISTILFLLDWYFYSNWKNFSLRENFPRWTRIVPLFGAFIFGMLQILLVIQRNTSFYVGIPNSILASATALWFFPKILLAPFFLLKDLGRICKKIYLKIFLKTSHTSHSAQKKNNDVESEIPQFSASPAAKSDESLQTVHSDERSSRRKFIERAGWAAASAPFIITAKGVLQTVHDFEVREIEIPLSNLPRQFDGFRIAQLSDIHAGSFPHEKIFTSVAHATNATKPDLITLTGDFVNFSPQELPLILPGLEKLRSPFGVVGSIGNHDHYMSASDHSKLLAQLALSGVNVMVNRGKVLACDGEIIQLAATDYTGMGIDLANLPKSIEGMVLERPIILLAHDPTFWDKQVRAKTSVDVMLSGHTHGGQFGTHILGKELGFGQIIYKQWAGLYQEGNQFLYVNRGLGTTGVPLRIGIQPEITVFTLRKVLG